MRAVQSSKLNLEKIVLCASALIFALTLISSDCEHFLERDATFFLKFFNRETWHHHG